MKIWLDEVYLGDFNNTAAVQAALSDWKKANSEHIFYLFECQGSQYSFTDSWEQFLQDNIGLDLEARIITATPEMLRLELVDSTRDYLERLAVSVEGLAAQFYAGPDESSWRMLSDFLEGLDYICQALEILNCDYGQDKFKQMLKELMEAMESEDIIAVADLLSYEWSEWLDMQLGMWDDVQ